MLSHGRGGFMDYGKYRDALTDIFWGSESGEVDDALAQAAALREQMMAPPEEPAE